MHRLLLWAIAAGTALAVCFWATPAWGYLGILQSLGQVTGSAYATREGIAALPERRVATPDGSPVFQGRVTGAGQPFRVAWRRYEA